MLLHELVTEVAAAHPDRPALIVDDQTTTFAQLDERVASLARAFRCAVSARTAHRCAWASCLWAGSSGGGASDTSL